MVASIVTLTAFLAVGLVSASPIKARTPYAVKETHYPPSQWQRVGPATKGHLINLQIGLRQGQFDELERHLYEVSDPSHHRYGQHLSADEVNDLIKPTDETYNLVHEWLRDNNIEAGSLEYSPAKDWIKITIPIEDIENLLDTEYSTYQHKDGEYIVRTPEWSLPLHLHDHIETIQPTNSFFKPRAVAKTMKKVGEITEYEALTPSTYKPPTVGQTAADVCNVSSVTPLCLRTLYGTINYTVQAAHKNKMALTDYLGESNNRSDTKLFLEQYRPEAASAAYSFEVQIINGGNNDQGQENATELKAGKDLEGNLDSETMLGIGYPTPLIAYTTGGSPPFTPDSQTPTDTNEPYLTWLQYMLDQKDKDLPGVVSNSYQDTEQTVPYSYAVSVCKGFAQLGARGVSVLFGSGDNGVGSDGTCISNVDNSTTFLAMFPSTCPYVTSVGGTKFINPEVVASDARNGYVSGGGFSRYFPRPSWQDAAVKPYLSSLPKNITKYFNATGRAFPDIAAQGYDYITVWNGTLVHLDGTSAATPTASAILALINDALIAAGKPTLGWLNPWLYKKGYKAFTDITSGSSSGCGTDGFPATTGWDAASGFGTPVFPKLKNLVLSSSYGHN
ncbi:2aceba83-2327-4523-8826-632c26887149 [Sclerotinia trifoliorum]|uniref:tripeptidyl-peptidase II n=1 Tax=Sclerotinia trifoliorum TaxID=28548 RepID=A0A8H2ZVL1_9HELO|nr:2aceba83-2327-4523-8826-632c26887149 [Sclerotinia trifoliorum]